MASPIATNPPTPAAISPTTGMALTALSTVKNPDNPLATSGAVSVTASPTKSPAAPEAAVPPSEVPPVTKLELTASCAKPANIDKDQ